MPLNRQVPRVSMLRAGRCSVTTDRQVCTQGPGPTHLWAHVVQGARPRDSTLLAQVDGEPKVCQLEAGAVVGKQDVLRLDVPVDDGTRVQVLWWDGKGRCSTQAGGVSRCFLQAQAKLALGRTVDQTAAYGVSLSAASTNTPAAP